MTDKAYKPTVTIMKAVAAAFVGGAGIAGYELLTPVAEGILSLPESVEQFKAGWPMVVVPVLMGLAKAGVNIYKNRNRKGSPVQSIRLILPLVVAAAILPACASGTLDNPFRSNVTHTIEYTDPDTGERRIETISESRFDQEAWEVLTDELKDLADLAKQYADAKREAEEEEDAIERAERLQAADLIARIIEDRRVVLMRYIDAMERQEP